MNNAGSILESLNHNRYIDELVFEAVTVAYNDEAKMKKSSRFIKKAFGRIISPKEEWYDMGNVMSCEDLEDSPLKQKYRSKYFNVRASYDSFPAGEVLEALKDIQNIPYERILKLLYRVSKEKFHIEQISNLRMIFQSDRNKNHRVELRYDRKLYKKDSGNFEDEIETPEETMKDEKVVEEERKNRARQEALKSKDTDEKEVRVKTSNVYKNMSNEIKPFVKEKIDESSIQKDSGAPSVVVKASSAIAEDMFDKCSKQEPDISRELIGVVSSLGGKMYGLDFRLKQPTSLGRKIATDTVQDSGLGGDVKKAAKDIKDIIRYTAIYPLDDFTEKYFATKEELEKLGYVETRCKNFYKKFEDGKSEQKAVQCVYFKKPDGVLFELQFHTPESQGVKDVNHPLYEECRGDDTPADRKLVLSERMRTMGYLVPNPVGVLDIPEHS